MIPPELGVPSVPDMTVHRIHAIVSDDELLAAFNRHNSVMFLRDAMPLRRVARAAIRAYAYYLAERDSETARLKAEREEEPR